MPKTSYIRARDRPWHFLFQNKPQFIYKFILKGCFSNMKTAKKILTLCLAFLMVVSCIPSVYAATEITDTIVPEAKGSLTLFKYDITSAEKDGKWDSSYVSTGVYDQAVNDALGSSVRNGDTDNESALGNGETSYGYAVKGVEFTYLKVADIVQFSDAPEDDAANMVMVLHGIDKTAGASLLKALGLAEGAKRYTAADDLDASMYYYQSDVLMNALEQALLNNATTVKNELEAYVAANGGKAMPLTDAYGKSQVQDLDLGLYLVIETKVPEMVVATCNPFFISIPMTTVAADSTNGGTRWIYNVTVYPKNETGIPSLEKTLRENKSDTGKHNGSTGDITDGYAHTGTASDGDIIDYQLISTLPSITSAATYLTEYTFVDTLSAGLSYNKNDVLVEFFSDAACKNLVGTWNASDGMFSVTYSTADNNASVMTIRMTEQGLAEINTNKRVYASESAVHSGYSDCTIRITYQATMHADKSVVYGDTGNPNEVVLLWKRTSQDYYDTLVDDAHLYTYAMELTKLFSDGNGNVANVEFIMRNITDGYYVKAELNKEEGVYYVVDHVRNESDATHFIPVKGEDNSGVIIVKGLEDDEYVVNEVRTDNGYTLLKDGIGITISRSESSVQCDIYTSDIMGLVQNDPRYASVEKSNDSIHTSQQKHLEHRLLTASATVDGKDVTMTEDNGSVHAVVPLRVTNTRGFDLPQTGDHGTWMFSVIGIALMAGAAAVIFVVMRKKRDSQ